MNPRQVSLLDFYALNFDSAVVNAPSGHFDQEFRMDSKRIGHTAETSRDVSVVCGSEYVVEIWNDMRCVTC